MLSNRQLFLQHQAQTSDFPLMLEIEKAEGVYLYDVNGQAYLDLISGIGVSNVGHRHPEIISAIQAQLDKYLHLMVYGEFVQAPQVLLAHALQATLPSHLNNTYLVNSGAEAVEGALKLAKRYTGRTELISCFNSYHGSTHGALSVTGSENFKRSFRPLLPDVSHIRYNHLPDLALITNRTAGVIIEAVQGEAGVRLPDVTYMRALREKCTQTGALLIMDEIQTGFGRTGTFWGFEKYGIVPDVVLCAKGMGGGMPIGAFISSSEIMGVFKNDPILGHITTFGGHPVSCAAALATLNVIQNSNLLAQVEDKANLFRQLLVHSKIKAIRNSGLLMAVEFESFEVLKPIIDKAITKGVITDWFLFCDNSMRLAPPLVITENQIQEACTIILAAIAEVS
ncbi:aspartate aminotransferase family protein [Adhaeribacter rhizoryzae]|uniref:Aspartate aminotransferase family protein n=1 Tax=Adhaeribacter rhizoryzae TaxID=2607907 RepID=A0A5M6D4T6_9BACT|nr:aspartate aminotransferase family protein [Adhaeribacter rhizoryzae]KAA5540769.1 aspartate aminotransferase family protein [Adhaeribacter rhizoryzae]